MNATADDIRHAYRLLLGREPDEGGFESLLKFADANALSAAGVAKVFFSSEEYKAVHGISSGRDEVDLDGLKLYPWRGDGLIGNSIKSSGRYEPHVLPRFVDSTPVGGTVLDVGANIGVYTLSAARKVGPSGNVFAVEPVAKNVQSLCAGVIGNRFQNVSILPFAASGRAGVIPILRSGNSSNGIVDAYVNPAMADEFVPTQRLDFVLGNLKRLDVVKIDIEGHEPVAWLGLEPLLRKHRSTVFMEFNPAAIRNHARVEPMQLLVDLFRVTHSIEVIQHDGEVAHCNNADRVMEMWEHANQRMNSKDGYCVDLNFKVDL